MANNTIQKQWDIGLTALDGLPFLRQLISAVSQENVQAQAVLTAEAMGPGLTVSDERIGEAHKISRSIFLDPLPFLDAEDLFRLLSSGQDRILSHRVEFCNYQVSINHCKLRSAVEKVSLRANHAGLVCCL